MATIDQLLHRRQTGQEPLPATAGGDEGFLPAQTNTRDAAVNAIMRYYSEQDQGVAMDPTTGNIYNVQGSSMSRADAEQLYDALTGSGWSEGQILGAYTGMGEPPGFQTISPDQAARLAQQEREFQAELPLAERQTQVAERQVGLDEKDFYASQEGLDAHQLIALGVPREWATAIEGLPGSQQMEWFDRKYDEAVQNRDWDQAEKIYKMNLDWQSFQIKDADRKYGLEEAGLGLEKERLQYDKDRDALNAEIAREQIAVDRAMVDAKIAGDTQNYEAQMAATEEASRHNKIIEGLEDRRVQLDEKKFTLDLATSPRNMMAGFFIAQGQTPPWMKDFTPGQVPTMHPAFAKALETVTTQQGGVGGPSGGQPTGTPAAAAPSTAREIRGRPSLWPEASPGQLAQARGQTPTEAAQFGQTASKYGGRIAQWAQGGSPVERRQVFEGSFAEGGSFTRPTEDVQGGAAPPTAVQRLNRYNEWKQQWETNQGARPTAVQTVQFWRPELYPDFDPYPWNTPAPAGPGDGVPQGGGREIAAGDVQAGSPVSQGPPRVLPIDPRGGAEYNQYVVAHNNWINSGMQGPAPTPVNPAWMGGQLGYGADVQVQPSGGRPSAWAARPRAGRSTGRISWANVSPRNRPYGVPGSFARAPEDIRQLLAQAIGGEPQFDIGAGRDSWRNVQAFEQPDQVAVVGEPQIPGVPNPEIVRVGPDRVDITPVNQTQTGWRSMLQSLLQSLGNRPSQWAGSFAEGGTIPKPFQDVADAGFPIPPGMMNILQGQPFGKPMDMAATIGGAMPSLQSLGKMSPSFAEFLISSLGAVYGQDFDDILWGMQQPYQGLRAITPGRVSYN